MAPEPASHARWTSSTLTVAASPAGAGGGSLRTSQAQAAEVVSLPAASRATAVIECGPSATLFVFQKYWSEVGHGPETFTPSTRSSIVTPGLSSVAAARISISPLTSPPQ